MDLEQDYVEYVAEFSLALLAISAAYFFDPYEPLSYLTLVLIPVLFGYTTYISRDNFSQSSLLALIALIFAVINYKLAIIAVIIAFGNILVSLFAGGERFRDFYSTTTLPMLILGILIGLVAFYAASSNPAVADEIRTSSASVLGDSVETAIENADIIESQEEAQKYIVEETSSQTVAATRLYVVNETHHMNESERQEVIGIMEDAEEDIPGMIADEAGEQIEDNDIDISETISELIEANFQGSTMAVLVPIAAISLYSLQPVVGLLTAVFASIFAFAARRGRDDQD